MSEKDENQKQMPQMLSVNGKDYSILKLLGRGKGGYSYLAERDGRRMVLKQIHHEPCAYYQFGDKIEAEIRDYDRLKRIGIPLPKGLRNGPGGQASGDLPGAGESNVRPALCRKYKYRLLPDKFYPAGRHAVLCGL